MPLRMILFILALVILVTFVGLNWENNSDIDLWFNQKLHLEDVSIVLSFLIVYLAGMVSSIPFWVDLSLRRKRKEKKMKEKNRPSIQAAPAVPSSELKNTQESDSETSDNNN